MKNSLLPIMGIMIYIILLIIDKFILKIPNYIYIPIELLSIILIIIGLIKDRKNKNS